MSGFLPRDLINEVKIRPGIYNKDVLEHPTRDHKRQLWLEVAERLTPAEDWETFTDVEKEVRMGEIATKWKNLKDHFYREIKLEEAGEAHKKRKYIYYDDMEFVRPFVGYKLPPMNKRQKINNNNNTNNNNNDSMESTQEFLTNETDIDMEAFLNDTDTVQEDDIKFVPDSSTVQEERAKTKRVIKPTFKVVQNKPSSSSAATNRLQKEAIIKNFNVLKKTDSPSNSTFKIRDGDITFCLSLVPTLRKLDDSRKLSAKIEILKVLRCYVDTNERRNFNNQSHASNLDNTTSSQCDDIEEDDMDEEHLEEYEDSVNIKQERRDDPLNGGGGGSGNTKIWWT
ncbi:peroxisomal ATPase PEX6-like [Calliphora vicina]|uniref:peroxisomal ATPase PEX6-like n=1 Tax=Calliphora vicina TaxID=7373 RepID=UPI00325BA8B1